MSTLEGLMYFVAFFLPLGVVGIGIAEGHWILGCIVAVIAISVSAGVVYYAGKKIPMKIAAAVVFFIVVGAFGLFASILENYKEKEKIEQRKQETERQAREKKEEAERKEREKKEEAEREANDFNKRKEIMKEKGYKAGYESGFTSTPSMHSTLDPRNGARSYYTAAWGAPVNEKERELFDIFSEEYVKGYEDGYRNR